MSMRYTVFIGAPSPSSILNDDEISYQWRTIASTLDPASQETSTDLFAGFPSSALDAASRRISALTGNVIFADKDEDGEDTQMVEEHLINDGRGRELSSSRSISLSELFSQIKRR
jgi:hypothetical protein